MPFIRGRYHINAIAGEALEAAREAEAALLALEHDAAQDSADQDDGQGDDQGGDGDADSSQDAGRGPIHRIEIEAAELVPSHSGRAQRGFVARVHRDAFAAGQSAGTGAPSAARGNFGSSGAGTPSGITSLRAPQAGQLPSRGAATRPETHVFADHQDLVSFLRDELAKQCKS
ncbi:MAG: hypothetical protein WA192_16830 [Candidatus Acidiferrales bacterium]